MRGTIDAGANSRLQFASRVGPLERGPVALRAGRNTPLQLSVNAHALSILIEFSVRSLGGVRPRAEALLARYRPERFHNVRLRLRSPVGAYSLSLAQVWPAFLNLLHELEIVCGTRSFLAGQEWDPEVLKKTEHLLYVLFEHIEDCDSILRACFPSENLYKKDDRVKEYRKLVDGYRDQLGRIVNAIKHEQGRLRSLVFYGDTYVNPGYFLEGVKADGSVGPDSRVHEGGDTAFSYAFDLRLHFVSLVVVSSLLARAVEAIVGPPDLSPEELAATSDLKFRAVAMQLANFSRILFPDEYRKPFPGIELRNPEGATVVRISYPSETERGKEPDEEWFHVTVSYFGDGVTRTFTVPYKLVTRGAIPARNGG